MSGGTDNHLLLASIFFTINVQVNCTLHVAALIDLTSKGVKDSSALNYVEALGRSQVEHSGVGDKR